MDTFGEYVFKVRSYECGRDGFVTMPNVCNYLQESASLNAASLKFSKDDFSAAGENVSWVLTKLRVKMSRYPRWEDEVKVTTFPRGGRKITALRDFSVSVGGEVIGLATSEWMLIDLNSRKIVAVPQSVYDKANDVREPVLGLEPFTRRLRFPEGAGEPGAAQSFRAMNAHIDVNGHVNNVHYLEWLLEPLGGVRPSELEVVFRSETLAGDEVRVMTAPGAPGETYHRVFATDGSDHVIARTIA